MWSLFINTNTCIIIIIVLAIVAEKKKTVCVVVRSFVWVIVLNKVVCETYLCLTSIQRLEENILIISPSKFFSLWHIAMVVHIYHNRNLNIKLNCRGRYVFLTYGTYKKWCKIIMPRRRQWISVLNTFKYSSS